MTTSRIPHFFRIALVTAALAVGGVAAHAQPGPGQRGEHGLMAGGGLFGGHIDHLLDAVNATDSQRTQIENIFKAARQDLSGQRDTGIKLHQQMATLYTANNVDAAAIEAVRVQLSALHETSSKRLSQASIDAARVLTPEQRAKIAEIMKKRQERMAARRVG
ncbi:MAG: periplasmic heavy metal sensor [Burkholderiales bacterium]|nr:MAG: periplasmic heavy metal sensor [Burkholderiales bacterium]